MQHALPEDQQAAHEMILNLKWITCSMLCRRLPLQLGLAAGKAFCLPYTENVW